MNDDADAPLRMDGGPCNNKLDAKINRMIDRMRESDLVARANRLQSRAMKAKNPHAVALGRSGGKARAVSLDATRRQAIARQGAEAARDSSTPEERTARAQAAARARWKGHKPKQKRAPSSDPGHVN